MSAAGVQSRYQPRRAVLLNLSVILALALYATVCMDQLTNSNAQIIPIPESSSSSSSAPLPSSSSSTGNGHGGGGGNGGPGPRAHKGAIKYSYTTSGGSFGISTEYSGSCPAPPPVKPYWCEWFPTDFPCYCWPECAPPKGTGWWYVSVGVSGHEDSTRVRTTDDGQTKTSGSDLTLSISSSFTCAGLESSNFALFDLDPTKGKSYNLKATKNGKASVNADITTPLRLSSQTFGSVCDDICQYYLNKMAAIKLDITSTGTLNTYQSCAGNSVPGYRQYGSFSQSSYAATFEGTVMVAGKDLLRELPLPGPLPAGFEHLNTVSYPPYLFTSSYITESIVG